MNKTIVFDIPDVYQGQQRIKDLVSAASELGYEVIQSLIKDAGESGQITFSDLFLVLLNIEGYRSKTFDKRLHIEGEKVVTAYTYLRHIYPLIVHGDGNWALEVVLDRQEALKFRYELGKLLTRFPENTLMEFVLSINEKREVKVINVRGDAIFTANESLDLAIHRSGIYWIDILEQALQYSEKAQA